jgi:hypothetical protein
LSGDRLIRDAAFHYPDGIAAHQLASVEAIEQQDFELALWHLRRFADRGGNFINPYFYGEPGFRPLLGDPRFIAFRRELAQREIEYYTELGSSNPVVIAHIASQRAYLGELDEAIEMIERSLRETGSLNTKALKTLERLRTQRADQKQQSTE